MNAEFIDVICLPVHDQERAKSFYTEALGFVVVRDTRGGPSHSRWIELGPEGAKTTVALVDAHTRKSRGPVEGLVLKVSNLAEFRARLGKHGLRPREIVEETWGAHLTLADPDGNEWILVEHEITS
jgi:catechol 2,3-dioxygenase-like lactoylglutathione lyase family enzyme